MQRTHIFYTAYAISRGMTSLYSNSLDADEYNKKCMWTLYFSTTRLKKFIYTWTFKPFRRNKINFSSDSAIREIELPSKEMILMIPFYVEIRDTRELNKDDPFYRIRAQFHEPNAARDWCLPIHVKD
jgi:hypothetical protein